MKKIIVLIITLIVSMACMPFSFCDESNSGTTIDIRAVKRGSNKKPTAPSRQRVTCDLFDTYLTIQFAFPEGTALIVIEEMENKTENIVNTSSEIFLPTNGMDFEKITITTEYGNTYEGYIQL